MKVSGGHAVRHAAGAIHSFMHSLVWECQPSEVVHTLIILSET
jgi:hypothetical protein